jgi:hypothetical protein
MDKSAISFLRMPYDDGVLRLVITATNGRFAGELEVYTNPEKLGEFSRRLNAFPSAPDDEARLELGSRDGNWAYYLLLRAFLVDRAGHAMLEFASDNREPSPYHAEANFFMPCEVAGIRRLGHRLGAWLDDPGELLSWTTADG